MSFVTSRIQSSFIVVALGVVMLLSALEVDAAASTSGSSFSSSLCTPATTQVLDCQHNPSWENMEVTQRLIDDYIRLHSSTAGTCISVANCIFDAPARGIPLSVPLVIGLRASHMSFSLHNSTFKNGTKLVISIIDEKLPSAPVTSSHFITDVHVLVMNTTFEAPLLKAEAQRYGAGIVLQGNISNAWWQNSIWNSSFAFLNVNVEHFNVPSEPLTVFPYTNFGIEMKFMHLGATSSIVVEGCHMPQLKLFYLHVFSYYVPFYHTPDSHDHIIVMRGGVGGTGSGHSGAGITIFNNHFTVPHGAHGIKVDQCVFPGTTDDDFINPHDPHSVTSPPPSTPPGNVSVLPSILPSTSDPTFAILNVSKNTVITAPFSAGVWMASVLVSTDAWFSYAYHRNRSSDSVHLYFGENSLVGDDGPTPQSCAATGSCRTFANAFLFSSVSVLSATIPSSSKIIIERNKIDFATSFSFTTPRKNAFNFQGLRISGVSHSEVMLRDNDVHIATHGLSGSSTPSTFLVMFDKSSIVSVNETTAKLAIIGNRVTMSTVVIPPTATTTSVDQQMRYARNVVLDIELTTLATGNKTEMTIDIENNEFSCTSGWVGAPTSSALLNAWRIPIVLQIPMQSVSNGGLASAAPIWNTIEFSNNTMNAKVALGFDAVDTALTSVVHQLNFTSLPTVAFIPTVASGTIPNRTVVTELQARCNNHFSLDGFMVNATSSTVATDVRVDRLLTSAVAPYSQQSPITLSGVHLVNECRYTVIPVPTVVSSSAAPIPSPPPGTPPLTSDAPSSAPPPGTPLPTTYTLPSTTTDPATMPPITLPPYTFFPPSTGVPSHPPPPSTVAPHIPTVTTTVVMEPPVSGGGPTDHSSTLDPATTGVHHSTEPPTAVPPPPPTHHSTAVPSASSSPVTPTPPLVVSTPIPPTQHPPTPQPPPGMIYFPPGSYFHMMYPNGVDAATFYGATSSGGNGKNDDDDSDGVGWMKEHSTLLLAIILGVFGAVILAVLFVKVVLPRLRGVSVSAGSDPIIRLPWVPAPNNTNFIPEGEEETEMLRVPSHSAVAALENPLLMSSAAAATPSPLTAPTNNPLFASSALQAQHQPSPLLSTSGPTGGGAPPSSAASVVSAAPSTVAGPPIPQAYMDAL